VLVKNCELGTLAAVNELLLLLPSDWAHVAKLAQGLLKVDLVVVEVLHHAATVANVIYSEEVVARKLQTSSDRVF
jgi:hypothetical protein